MKSLKNAFDTALVVTGIPGTIAGLFLFSAGMGSVGVQQGPAASLIGAGMVALSLKTIHSRFDGFATALRNFELNS